MKTSLVAFGLILSVLLLSNCKKEKDPPADEPAATASQYFLPLKTGNYWVYKKDSENGTYPNYTITTRYDTVKVVRDTVIGQRTYFEITGGVMQGIGNGLYADSSGWIIREGNHLFELSTAANDTVAQDTMGAILYVVYKTGNTDTAITVPAGTFPCSEMIWDIYYLYETPPAPHTNPRQLFMYFSKNIGLVKG